MKRSDLTINEVMSGKDFTQQIHGRVVSINGASLGIRFKIMKGDKVEIPVNHWQHAMVDFLSGDLVDTSVQISSSASYVNLNSLVFKLILSEGPSVAVGDTLRLRWELSALPKALWADDIVGSQFQQDVVGSSPIPADVSCSFYASGLNNIRLPVGCTTGTVDGMRSSNVHHEIQDGEQWIVDPDSKEQIALLSTNNH